MQCFMLQLKQLDSFSHFCPCCMLPAVLILRDETESYFKLSLPSQTAVQNTGQSDECNILDYI